MTKTILLSISLAVLTACSQNPQFKINTANQVYTALNDLQVLLARAEIGTLTSPSSFAKTADSYAQIMGGFQAGRFVAVGLPADVDILDANAVNPETNLIDQCIAQIKAMAAAHKASGIGQTADIITTVRTRCDAAARSVAANESSALILTTAAGTL